MNIENKNICESLQFKTKYNLREFPLEAFMNQLLRKINTRNAAVM